MKKGAAVIAEFNPFHRGHGYIIEKAREKADFVGVVMSGSFVQRGEPALFDKFLRTRAALLNGADIVVELSVVYATGGADVFAYGGCDTVCKAGIFDSLVFGCESEDMTALFGAAEILSDEPVEFKRTFQKYIKTGMSYPKARGKALSESLSVAEGELFLPNNILAVEYIKCLRTMRSDIKLRGIKRRGDGYNNDTPTGEFSSAAAIRKAFAEGDCESVRTAVPENVFQLYKEEIKKGTPGLEDYGDILRYIILREGTAGIEKICGVTEGLENSIYKNSDFESVEELLSRLKSKRYTMTRLRRIACHIILGIKKSDAYPPKPVPYIRVLGVKKEKRELLSRLKNNSAVPVIINVKKDAAALPPEGRFLLNKEIFAANIRAPKSKDRDYTEGLIII